MTLKEDFDLCKKLTQGHLSDLYFQKWDIERQIRHFEALQRIMDAEENLILKEPEKKVPP